MASYTRYLAEKIEEVECTHDGKCYHDLTNEQRTQSFHEAIDKFVKEWKIKFRPYQDIEEEEGYDHS